MKEGYLQTKIVELKEKCNQIDQMILMEKSKILLLQEQVGGFKNLLKKLKDIDEIKEDTVYYINKENEKLMIRLTEELSKKNIEIIETFLKQKTKKIDGTLDYLKKREKDLDSQSEAIELLTKKIRFLIEHNNLLMMKLANKGFLSEREINEMHRRSNKKD